jgi:hypothetical protein
MSGGIVQKLVSILEESPLYPELTHNEKLLLVQYLTNTYPHIFIDRNTPLHFPVNLSAPNSPGLSS